MKTERRQELRTNDLAHFLAQGRDYLQTWGSYIMAVVVVVVVVIAFVAYRAKAEAQESSDAWNSLTEVQKKFFLTQSGEKRTNAEINTGFEELEKLANGAKNADLLFESLASKVRVAMRLSAMGNGGVDSVYLDKAEQACNALKDRLPDNSLAVATALNSMVSVEADRFVLDGDLSRKDRVRVILEQLRDDSRFANTPFQRSALDRLNRLDEVFRPVVLAPAPVPTLPPSLEAILPVAKPAPGKVEVKRVPAPPQPKRLDEQPANTDTGSEEEVDSTPDVPPGETDSEESGETDDG